jgi:ATP-binding cassette subfamily B protein/subfamily B ATP-binding cassette protein MsbA
MKNFLRSLRFAYPYRFRLGISIACALLAAALWGTTLTAIYPSLKILGSNKSLQQSVDDDIATTEELVSRYQSDLLSFAKELERIKQTPESQFRDKAERDVTSEMVRIETKLNSSRTMLYRLQLVKGRVLVFLPNDRFQTLAWLMGILVLTVAIKGIFEFWQESLVGSVVNLSLYDLRNQLYRKAIHYDMSSFGEEGTHELMSRFTNDIELLGTGTKTLFGKVVAEPLRALSCVVLACWISWQLTLLFLVLVPLSLFFLGKVGRLMKRATRRLLERMSVIYKMIQETFQGIRIVKAFTMEPYERRRFRAATRDYYQKAMLVVNIDALASPVIELLGVGAVGVALLAGAYLVMNHETHLFGMRMTEQPLDAEGLLQLYGFLVAIADPVRKLSSVYTRLQSGAAAADRIFSYLDRQPQIQANPSAPRMRRHESTIEFRGVCFSYKKPGNATLSQVSLTCQFGETIAIVGTNGCGKTTLLSLLPRFYDPDHGSILIDGVDIREVTLRSLRKQIALVTQDTMLFDDTVYNNIAYGHRRANKEQVEQAAIQTFAHEFIEELKEGYQYRVGEKGTNLSGGQRQRIALARAVLRNPSILILDEFTNQTDLVSQARIHQWLREFARHRTTFIITHRLNTLELADRIVVLNAGRIEAVGQHRDLLASCSTYQRLHDAEVLKPCA